MACSEQVHGRKTRYLDKGLLKRVRSQLPVNQRPNIAVLNPLPTGKLSDNDSAQTLSFLRTAFPQLEAYESWVKKRSCVLTESVAGV
jgi:hypothetical protein